MGLDGPVGPTLCLEGLRCLVGLFQSSGEHVAVMESADLVKVVVVVKVRGILTRARSVDREHSLPPDRMHSQYSRRSVYLDVMSTAAM